MHLRRSEVVEALRQTVQSLADCVFDIDGEGVEDFTPAGGYAHGGMILSGRFRPSIKGGAQGDWEGTRDCTVIYQTTGADRVAREAARDAFVDGLITLLEADRSLGLPDPQVWAEISDSDEQNAAPIADAAGVTEAVITIDILYTAASAAG